jgi:hypothetical protein
MKNQPPTRTTTVMLRAAPKFGRRRWHVLMPEAPIRPAALNSGAKALRIQRLRPFFRMANRMRIRLCCRNANQDRDA